MSPDIVIGGIYQHYKGMNYLVHNLARHSETLEWMVFYEALYENSLGRMWIRPMTMFLENVEINGTICPRFKYIGKS